MPRALRAVLAIASGIAIGAGASFLAQIAVAVVIEDGDTGKYNAAAREQMKGWSDGRHPSPGVHAMLADRLARDLRLLGY